MKRFLMVLFAALFLGTGSLWAMGSFEGVVDYQMTMGGGKQMDVEYMIKGKKFRSNMEHDGMQMSTIMDLSSKKMITLMHKQKMYMTHTLDKAMTEASKQQPKGKFSKASGSKEILGYSCDHYVYESEHGKTDMWLAKGIGTFMGMSSGKPGSSSGEEWMGAIKGKGLFPLEIDSTGNSGKTMTMVVTKLEKKSLSADLFEVPSGYKKMPDYGDMMKGQQSPTGDDMMKSMKPKLPF